MEKLDLENFKKFSRSKVQMNQQVSNPVTYQSILNNRQIQYINMNFDCNFKVQMRQSTIQQYKLIIN